MLMTFPIKLPNYSSSIWRSGRQELRRSVLIEGVRVRIVDHTPEWGPADRVDAFSMATWEGWSRPLIALIQAQNLHRFVTTGRGQGQPALPGGPGDGVDRAFVLNLFDLPPLILFVLLPDGHLSVEGTWGQDVAKSWVGPSNLPHRPLMSLPWDQSLRFVLTWDIKYLDLSFWATGGQPLAIVVIFWVMLW